jgi:hypothetical protein
MSLLAAEHLARQEQHAEHEPPAEEAEQAAVYEGLLWVPKSHNS